MSRCRLQSGSHVIESVNVLAMLPSSVALAQFINNMVSLLLQGSDNQSALASDDLLTVPWASP